MYTIKLNHRITESQNHIGWKRPLRSSSPTINLTLPKPPLHHVSKHLIQTSFKYLQGWRLNHFPGQPVPMLDNPLGEEKFPNIQSKPPLAQLEAISSCPITCYLGEETNPHLSTTSFQVVEESDKVSPQPPFLQAKQSQLPQPLLIRLLLQTLHQLCCPSLHTLQYLNIPMRRPYLGIKHKAALLYPLKLRKTKGRALKAKIRLLKAPSNLTLYTSNDGASTTSLGNLVERPTTIIVKNFFLMSNLNLPSFSLKPLLLVLLNNHKERCSIPLIIFVALLWIRSNRSMSCAGDPRAGRST
ncbi:hypothetical protein QYF61_015227, partial [Mycteria americana]